MPASPVWAITCYFPFDDPAGVKRRLGVYREFRRHLRVPLAAIELSLDGAFDLTSSDADLVLQVGGDLMWQKERLLNRLIEVLPPECDTVAWLDCDVILRRPDWAEAARDALQNVPLLQPFQKLHFIEESTWDETAPLPTTSVCHESVAALHRRGALPRDGFSTTGSAFRIGYTPGMAWAASRAFLRRYSLYDAAILGAGDKLMFSAACAHASAQADAYQMCRRHKEHYLAWAEPFSREVGGNIGYLDGDLYHLWHGELSNRNYKSRHVGFDAYRFDPVVDLARTDGGAWRWNSDKPDMHSFVRRFFEQRKGGNEDFAAPRNAAAEQLRGISA